MFSFLLSFEQNSSGAVSNEKGQQPPPAPAGSGSAPQSARQRLAKLTASLIGGINPDALDTPTSPSDTLGKIHISVHC